ncbi:hypothetical protein REJC140_00659 [Pseudorhizobium endolithicum]|uniref:DUF982 domain-containing protein n=1 Tax=Pseudorhizobium endolithicum TaxID=1191678 RepID=A0ABN7JNB9_9HYPH|nr:DUF982 domain-containing protein [Pseudorhizobium endolithicum]CAD7038718.1 hypothetical protein REJC140_00659 [Pseudorhizobium endolithicum]
MNMMIRTSDVRWLTPVRVRIGYGFPETIRTPHEALSYLHYRWPAVDGDHYRQAKVLCAEAVEHPGLTEAAREAFLHACIEAKMLDEAPSQMPLTAR